MMHRGPAFLLIVPGEHRKLDDPGKVHRLRVVKLQFRAEALSQGVQRLAGDVPGVGHEQQQVARLGSASARGIFASSSALKFLAIGDAELAVGFDLEPGQPLRAESA